MQSFCHLFLSSCEGKSVEVMWTEFKEALNSSIQKLVLSKIVSEYDQEIPQSQTADNPVAPRGRAAQPSQDTRKTN